ncbi:hypothetical protein [Methanobacterium oryzae]|uniref:hypothetical protein n=1 Tax=Methanobacterium oryzae TaxID=69540 RepID=UPI003D1F03A1
MIRTWILSAIHWLFGGIFLLMGLFGLLKMNFSEYAVYSWVELVLGITIIVLGFLFAKNILKPSRGNSLT